jgi:putative membrane protein
VLPGPTSSTAINAPLNQGVTDVADQDRQFLIATSQAEFAQKEASLLAEARSSSASVKDFARHLLAVRGRIEDQINLLAQSKGIALSNGDAGKYSALLVELKQENGSAFDRTYRDQVAIGVDQEGLTLNQNEQQNGKDQDLKTLAQTISQSETKEINAAGLIGATPRSAAANSSSSHHPT